MPASCIIVAYPSVGTDLMVGAIRTEGAAARLSASSEGSQYTRANQMSVNSGNLPAAKNSSPVGLQSIPGAT